MGRDHLERPVFIQKRLACQGLSWELFKVAAVSALGKTCAITKSSAVEMCSQWPRRQTANCTREMCSGLLVRCYFP